LKSSWPQAKLEDLIAPDSAITYGVIKPGGEGSVRFVRGGDIADGIVLEEELRTITAAVSEQYKRTLLRGGELLMSLVGQPGQVAVTSANLIGANIARQVGLIRLRREFDPHFISYFLRSPDGVAGLGKFTGGSVQQVINLGDLRQVSVPTPALTEQRRIIAILDEAFEGIATAKANAEKNLQNARGLFESHLATVFSARNEGWTDRTLHSLCRRITVGHVGSMANLYKPTGIPFLRSQNIRPFSVSMSNMVFIDEDFHAALGKSSLQAGDVAIVRTGYPGTAAVIPDSLGVANCSDLVIVRPGPEIDAHFLTAFFNSAFGKSMVSGKVVGAAQKHFNIGAAKDVMLHLPPLAEQEAIVAAADELRNKTDHLEGLYTRELEALEELKKSLLHQAFTGAL
jgi:type I restriction enzyme S subunit